MTSYTPVSITDVAQYPDGIPIPYAVVVGYPKQGFTNAGTTTNAASVVANAAGAFTLVLNSTDDAGTVAIDPALSGQKVSYHVLVFDPKSGEHVYDADVYVPHANTPTTLAALPIA